MKIYDSRAAVLPEVKNVERPVKKELSALASGDMVAISSKAVEMQEAVQIARNAPDIRAVKVQLLKEEISKGMYSVRGNNVAEKMMEEIAVNR